MIIRVINDTEGAAKKAYDLLKYDIYHCYGEWEDLHESTKEFWRRIADEVIAQWMSDNNFDKL